MSRCFASAAWLLCTTLTAGAAAQAEGGGDPVAPPEGQPADEEPVEPGEPADPAEPAEPAEASEPEAAGETEEPAEQGEAAEPGKPTEPAEASVSEQPGAGEGPDEETRPAVEDSDAEGDVDPPIAADEERPLPDYDGRGDDPVTAGDVLIWIPRGLFYPVYLVAEYVIRWPLGKLTVAAEEHDVPRELVQFFTFGPDDNYGIVPSFLIDFGIRPSIGLYFFGDDVGDVKGFAVRSHLAFGGIDWYRATGSVRYTIDEDTPTSHEKYVQLKGVYSHRPDWQYWGQGPRTLDDHESSFTMQEIEGVLTYDGGFWRSSYLIVEAAVRDVAFKEEYCCAPISLVTAVDRGLFPMPEVFDDGYLLASGGVEAALDTRPRRSNYAGDASDHVSPPGHGVKLGGRAEVAGGLRETELVGGGSARPLFVRYGGTLGGFVDVFNQRVIGLQAVVDFVDPIGDGIVPFTELADLGGARPLRGFQTRRLVDRSAAAAILEYQWPIWVWLDGALHYGVGNVFGEHLKGFEPGLWRQSFGLGFRANDARDHTFELLLAGGTKPFDEGGDVESFRFVFGSTAGF